MNTYIQVLYGLTKVLTVLQRSLKSPYANSQIYSSRNICPMASRFPHRSGLLYAPVCVPVYAPGLTDRSQQIRFSACSADPADVEFVSQQGASFHLTPDRKCFSSYKAGDHGSVKMGNEGACRIVSIGDVCSEMFDTFQKLDSI